MTVALVINDTVSTTKTYKLDATHQSYTFDNLPLTDTNGDPYTYSITEQSVTGVDTTKYSMTLSGSTADGYTVTNTEYSTQVPVEKIWKNSDLTKLPWPKDATATVQLVADGVD